MALGRANARFLDACFRRALRGRGARPRAARAPASRWRPSGSFGRGAVALRSDADVVVVVGRAACSVARSAPRRSPRRSSTRCGTRRSPVGHQVLSAADAVCRSRRQDLATATALLDLRLLAGDEALCATSSPRANEGLFAEQELGGVHRAARGGGRRAPRALRRLGVPARARREERRRGAARPRRRRAGRRARATASASAADGEPELGVVGRARAPRRARRARGARDRRGRGVPLARAQPPARARRRARPTASASRSRRPSRVAMGYGDDRARAAERLMQDYYLHARAVTRARESLLRAPAAAAPARARASRSDLGGGRAPLRRAGHHRRAARSCTADPALALRALRGVRAAAARRCCRSRATRSRARRPTRRGASACARAREAARALRRARVHRARDAHARAARWSASCTTWGCCSRWCRSFSRSRAACTTTSTTCTRSTFTRWPRSIACGSSRAASSRTSSRWRRASPPRSRARGRSSSRRSCTTSARGGPTRAARARTTRRRGAELCDAHPAAPRPAAGGRRRGAPARPRSPRSCTTWRRGATSTTRRRSRSSAAGVRGREGLRNLYLLTVADLSTTSPTAMTSWKARMLDELYFAAEAHLAGQAAARPTPSGVARVRGGRARGAGAGASRRRRRGVPRVDARALPARERAGVDRRARARRRASAARRAAHVARVPSRHPEAAELCVVAEDRPGLLASIAAAITANRLEVLAAQVYSRAGRATACEAVDLFWVRDRDGGTEGVERALPRLARDLDDVCSGASMPAELLALAHRARRRPGASGRAPRCRPRCSSTTAPRRGTRSSRSSPRTARACSTRSPRALHELGPVDRAVEDQHRGDARGRRLLRERARRLEGRARRRATRQIHDALVKAIDGLIRAQSRTS